MTASNAAGLVRKNLYQRESASDPAFFEPPLPGSPKHQADNIFPEPLTRLNNRIGDDKRSFSRQKDIQMQDELAHGMRAEQGHTCDSPDHHFHRKPSVTERNHTSINQTLVNQFR
ncbi:hypothetical protein [Izhakiella australiensis]|uniref:hypothetical protein n=1 Tax=Izhakiella australiensis TaxID=1926881 RepID=UPI001F528877|nr:hypothetical protein [Izhakiella australiensis]